MSAINKTRRTTSQCEASIEAKDEGDGKIAASTQFLSTQKEKIIVLPDQFYCYVNILLVFGFNSAEYDLNLIKSYLVPQPVNETGIEPTAVIEVTQFESFKFGNIYLLDIMNFFGCATNLDFCLKAYKRNKTKRFFT